MNAIATEIAVIVLLILVNGVLAMSEMALVSARKARLKSLADQGDVRARAALELTSAPNRFLSTVQVGITLVGVLAGAFGGATLAEQIAVALARVPLLAPYSEALGIGAVVLGITYLSLILGELVPKRLALGRPESIARLVARPMTRLAALAGPVVRLMGASTDLVLRVLGQRDAKPPPVTEEEVRTLMAEGLEEGVFHAAEPRMVEGVLALDRLPVRELMTPRAKIIWVNVTEPHDSIWHKIVVSGHTTFPVFEGTRDNVVGMVSIKAIYANLAAGIAIRVKDLMTPPLIVPASQTALALLDTFKKSRIHVALVIDEFGGIVGLVTLHDLMEAVLGEVPSQDERLKPAALRRDDGSWLVDGALQLDDLAGRMTAVTFPPPGRRDYETVAGFVLAQLGRVPREGETFDWQGYRFEVIDMDRQRIDKVLAMPWLRPGTLPEPKPPGA